MEEKRPLRRAAVPLATVELVLAQSPEENNSAG
jgi:hypothetical protein